MLSTQRMVIRRWGVDETEKFFHLLNQPEITPFLWNARPASMQVILQIFEESEATFASEGFGVWTLTEPCGQSIGFMGCRRIFRTDRIELLYCLSPAYWRQGLATEAALAILRYVFTECALQQLEASVHPFNVRSAALLRRIGYTMRRTEETTAGTLQVWSIDRSTFSSHSSGVPTARAS